MRFYLDEDLSSKIAEGLRKRGADGVSALEVGNTQLPDREQLRYAARGGRCLVTRNVRHFTVLARDAIRRNEPHAGIALCPPSIRSFETGKIVATLIRLSQQFPTGLGEFDVVYI
jgi:predicted nuclease of predicted toxin-antitoxin system